MALRDKVTKEEVLKYGSVAAALIARNNITPPRKLVIIATSEDPSDQSHTVVYDIEKESPVSKPVKPPMPKGEIPIAIIKIPKGANANAVGAIADALANAIGGKVFIFPLDFEIMLGKAARDQINNVHKFIHDMLDIKEDKKK